MSQEQEYLLVRIKPYNKAQRRVVRTYVYRSYKYVALNGWYKVRAELAEKLRGLLQPDSQEVGVFDVMTAEGAAALHAREVEAESSLRAPSSPNIVNTEASISSRAGKRGGARRSAPAETKADSMPVTETEAEPTVVTEEPVSFDFSDSGEEPTAPPKKKSRKRAAPKSVSSED